MNGQDRVFSAKGHDWVQTGGNENVSLLVRQFREMNAALIRSSNRCCRSAISLDGTKPALAHRG